MGVVVRRRRENSVWTWQWLCCSCPSFQIMCDSSETPREVLFLVLDLMHDYKIQVHQHRCLN